jgi:hypothetical protein
MNPSPDAPEIYVFVFAGKVTSQRGEGGKELWRDGYVSKWLRSCDFDRERERERAARGGDPTMNQGLDNSWIIPIIYSVYILDTRRGEIP